MLQVDLENTEPRRRIFPSFGPEPVRVKVFPLESCRKLPQPRRRRVKTTPSLLHPAIKSVDFKYTVIPIYNVIHCNTLRTCDTDI